MVGIKFCECLLFVTVEEPQYFISISMSHAWRPPSHAFLLVPVCLHAVAYHEVGSSDILTLVWSSLRLAPTIKNRCSKEIHTIKGTQ